MTAIDFLVEKLKLESIDLSLWHQNLIDEANKNLRKQINNAYDKGFLDANCQCFRLGDGSPWQTYLCEIHKDK